MLKLGMDQQQLETNVRFGREMNRARRSRRYTQERLGKEIGVSQSYVGGLERGERKPDLALIQKMDEVLRTDGRLTQMWTMLSNDGEPVWLSDLSELQRSATSIAEVHTYLFPAFLQREEYASAAVTTLSPWLGKKEAADRVGDRMERAAGFLGSTGMYRVVVDATVLRRCPDNDPGLMRDQLTHVIQIVEAGRAAVQVVSSGWHPGLVGPFTLIASPNSPEVVYIESAYSGRVIDDPEVVQRFRVLFGDAQAVAASPKESLSLLRDELERLQQ